MHSRQYFPLLLAALLTLATGVSASSFAQSAASTSKKAPMPSVYDYTVTTIDGQPKPLAGYKGDVLLFVNTASECGYTPQYETMEKLYETYKARGLKVLAFPSNDFGEQEPGTNAEIKTFCNTKFHTTFDLFEKITVKGKNIHPLYKYLTEDSPYPGEVKWNFQKYLVDRSGKVVARFPSKVDPMAEEVRKEVEKALTEKKH